MVRRLFVVLSLLLPGSWLLLAAFFPQLDPILQVPLAHFYAVTLFTFAAAVVAFFTAVVLKGDSAPRHRLLATAFAVMGLLFLVHGVTTPNAIITTFNPGISWAAWLTLFTGGFIFALAALDAPGRPLALQRLSLIHWALGIFCGGFVLIVAFRPGWLSLIDQNASPWHQQMVYLVTLAAWLFASWRLTLTWRQTGRQIDGIMALVAAWLALGTVSLHSFPVWHSSWWLYHGELMLGVITAVWTLTRTYERLRHFRTTYYYAALGLILSGGLSLLASYLVSRLVERSLQMQQAGQAAASTAAELTNLSQTILVNARLNGLLISGLTIGLLFVLLLLIVGRADRLVAARGRELTQAYADLQAAEAMRDDLTDMVVHDLRTPLTAVQLNISLLEKSLGKPEKLEARRRFVGNAQRSVERVLELVNQILDVAKLESGQLPLNYESFSVAELLQDKLKLHQSLAQADDKQLRLELNSDPMPLVADRELIGRVLDNLIGNALKYTDRGGKVTLAAHPQQNEVVLQVTDDGEGLDVQLTDRIFDKFYQVTGVDGRPLRQGSGLGLSFCKLVVEAHRGRIWAESQPGQGSIFTFTLPNERAGRPAPEAASRLSSE